MDMELVRAAASGRSVLVTVISTRGSAPRHAGSKMLWRKGEPLLGTVGGGRLEASAIAKAEAIAKTAAPAVGKDGAKAGTAPSGSCPALIEVEMLGEAALGQDMICGGASLMLVEPVTAETCVAYRAALGLLEGGRRALLVKRVAKAGSAGPIPGDLPAGALVAVLDESLGIVATGDSGVRAAAGAATGAAAAAATLDEGAARKAIATGKPVLAAEAGLFYDPLFPEEKLVILGGGHVGLALARLATELDFSVTVVDDREEMAEAGRYPEGTKVVVSGYADAIRDFAFDPATYAVVLTRGHVYDLECARALMGRDYRYAGMIGSARKTRLILEQLRTEGLDPAKIDAFCAPIGLDIEAETPAEIAVCILGEMIAFRRNAKALAAMAEARKGRRA